MKKKYLKLKSNEELIVISDNNKAGISIKSDGKKLIINEQFCSKGENICINSVDNNFLVAFELAKLIEDRDFTIENAKCINKILDNYYKKLYGRCYDKEIIDVQFQCVVRYDNSINENL